MYREDFKIFWSPTRVCIINLRLILPSCVLILVLRWGVSPHKDVIKFMDYKCGNAQLIYSSLTCHCAVGRTGVCAHSQLAGHRPQHPAQHQQQQLQGQRTGFPLVPACKFHLTLVADVFVSLSALIATTHIRIQSVVYSRLQQVVTWSIQTFLIQFLICFEAWHETTWRFYNEFSFSII